MYTLVSFILAYLIGSIACSIIVAKILKRPDPREHGSKNAGTTNILRTTGKQAALYVMLGDVLKGLVAVILARLLHVHDFGLACVALIAVLGHIYPLYFKFKGGKGVATMLGALLGLSFWIGLFVIATWVILLYIFRYASLASLASAVAAPIYTLVGSDFYYFVPILAISGLIIWKHWDNISRLYAGTEDKINLDHFIKPRKEE